MTSRNDVLNRVTNEPQYDPVKRAEEVAKIVCRDDLRKYYRFRPARFYGGIATADCVGCCLRCLFCWSWSEVTRPERSGRWHSPQDVADRLTSIVYRKGFRQMRISGNEPTIAREHLLRVLELVPGNVVFILETNGVLIGYDRSYAEDLARYENIYVRISFKGCNEEEFAALTGAEPKGFVLQLQALENLYRAGVKAHPAVMASFSPSENVKNLQRRLGTIDEQFEDVEIEELIMYGSVEKRLKNAKMLYACTSRSEPEKC